MVQLPNEQYGDLVGQRDRYYSALVAAQRLCKEALPKFNWGASALDANAILLLNEVPALIDHALRAHQKFLASPQVPQDEFSGIASQRMQREFDRTDAIVAGLINSRGHKGE